MEREKALMFLFSASLILLLHKPLAQPTQRPLCVSQFSLVSYACRSLPFASVPGPNAIPSPDDDYLTGDDAGGGVGSDDKHQESRHGGRHEQHRGHEHRQGHRDRDGEHGDEDGKHRHGHRRRHRQRQEPAVPVPPSFEPPRASPAVENCCRWLKTLDDECVCDLLTHLPPFLSKPLHDYSISIGQSCRITYHCLVSRNS